MRIFNKIVKIYHKYKLYKLKKRGLTIADDCILVSFPDFGSEPYLIQIEENVKISSKVTFITHDGGSWIFRKDPDFSNIISYGQIVIKKNCFIGYGVIIMPNVIIGENSVIGAGSIVTKNVPPNSIVAGIPAKILMSSEEYKQKLILNNPCYSLSNYKLNKRSEIEKHYKI